MRKLLIVDDNPGDRELVMAYLEEARAAYECEAVGSLAEARRNIDPSHDLVLLDLGLPDGVGIDLIPELRALDSRPAVVVLSGASEERLAIEAVRAGAYDYLDKDGLSPALLDRTFRAAIEVAASERALEAQRASLAESEARFRAFVNSMPDPAWAGGADGVPYEVNAAWRARFSAGLVPWIELVCGTERGAAEAAWREALRERTPLEMKVQLSTEGRPRWHIARIQPAKPPATEWYGTLTDVQELELARAKLERADRSKNSFMAVLGHELRNPLNALTLACENLSVAPQMIETIVPIIRRQLGTLRRLTDDLNAAAQLTKRELELGEVELGEVIEDALSTARNRFSEHDIEVHYDGPERLEIRADRVRLIQVVSNLLSNAGKFAPKGGNVWVSVGLAGDKVELRVADDGPGIPDDLLPVLFEPFTQSAGSRKRGGGLGLGLSIVRGLVQLHGGEVRAESRPGGGACICVVVPLAGPPRELSSSSTSDGPTTSE